MKKPKIRVVATDLDGTLFNEKHTIDELTYKTIKEIQEKDVRFVVVTGRDYQGAMETLREFDLNCDCIVGSGAEIWDAKGNRLHSIPMETNCFEEIMDCLKNMDVTVRFCTKGMSYIIGDEKRLNETFINEMKIFFPDTFHSDEEILQSDIFKRMRKQITCVRSLEELLAQKRPIFKVFISSLDLDTIVEANRALAGIPAIASASSFLNNIELTNVRAQKGPVLKEYIEGLGYQMDEVMVLGDSMNDYSMLSMDFGVTVAMENAMEDVKKVVKYITKRNDEHGFVHAVKKYIDVSY